MPLPPYPKAAKIFLQPGTVSMSGSPSRVLSKAPDQPKATWLDARGQSVNRRDEMTPLDSMMSMASRAEQGLDPTPIHMSHFLTRTEEMRMTPCQAPGVDAG